MSTHAMSFSFPYTVQDLQHWLVDITINDWEVFRSPQPKAGFCLQLHYKSLQLYYESLQLHY